MQLGISFTWTALTYLTGACSSQEISTLATVLSHAPKSLIGSIDDNAAEWEQGLHQFCTDARAACVEDNLGVRCARLLALAPSLAVSFNLHLAGCRLSAMATQRSRSSVRRSGC